MSDDKPKKKRFEGLIQFREALRQTIVCLQASMGDRFAHSLQSALIRQLDQISPKAHHLIFARGAGSVGPVDEFCQLEPRHLLARIQQQEAEDLKEEINWHGDDQVHISLWLDPTDPLVASYFFRLVSLACHDNTTAFDLKQGLAWGGTLRSRNAGSILEAEIFVREYSQIYGLGTDRVESMVAFLQHLQSVTPGYESVHLLADGTFVGLVVEAHSLPERPVVSQQTIDRLLATDAHTLAICDGGPDSGKCQFAMFTPIRLQARTMGLLPLKGFVVLRSLVRRASVSEQRAV